MDDATGAPTARSGSRPALLAGVAVVVLVADQLTKTWAQEALADHRTIDLVGSLRFRLVYNPGGAFSLFGGGGWGPLISVAAVAVLVLLLWQSRTMSSRLGTVAMGLVLGGAVGNLVDRAFRGDDGFLHGEVIDFIDAQFWPVFNVADIGVVCGAIGLLVVGIWAPAEPVELTEGSTGGDDGEDRGADPPAAPDPDRG